MSRHALTKLLALGLLALGQAATVHAQSPLPTLNGDRPWVVVIKDLRNPTASNDPSDKAYVQLADFALEDDAKKYAKKLNDEEKDSTRWSYCSLPRRKSDDAIASTVPKIPLSTPKSADDLKSPVSKPKSIDDPNRPSTPKSVDASKFPPSLTSSKAKSLAGRKGKGTVDNIAFTIRFTGSGNSGSVVFDVGDTTLDGTWEQTGENLVIITPNARFRGVIDRDQITGQRYWREGKKPIAAWSVTLQESSGKND